INAPGHSYTAVVTAPTCENGGYTTHTCSKCGDEYQDGEKSANGHAWGEPKWQWATNYLTCSAKFTCSTCNKEQTETASVEHNSATASCTVAGDTTHTASVNFNNKSYSDSKVVSGQTLPHTWELKTESVPPDCENDGAGEFECKVCHKVETRAIEALGHDFADEFTTDKEATCTEEGSKSKHCSRCDETTEVTAIEKTGHTPGEEATCTTAQTCDICGAELAPATGHTEVTDEAQDPTCTDTGLTAGKHCGVCDTVITAQEEVPALGHDYQWVITKEATAEEAGLMENKCTVCGDKDGEEEIAKLVDPNGEIDLPVDINVEFKVTQSSTDNDYSDIEKGLKRGYWAQLWYRNDDGTLGDEFMDTINCFLTLKIPTEIIEAIRGGEEINRDKIAAGLKVFYIDGEGTPVEVENFTIAMRDDDSWQIKFNYNEKFRAEVVFAADLEEQPAEPETTGIPWWVWLIVGLVVAALLGIFIIIIVVAKKKKNDNNPTDNGEVLQ
ncbi:MAG: hypothetical protein K2O67_03670, partial [Clostridia bacterium]|nr:hypothetical protein [Clostridia bacterium]